MSLRTRLIKRLGGTVVASTKPAASSRSAVRPRLPSVNKALRAYKAAQNDRLVADWLSTGGDINQELKTQLPTLRSRSREAEQNSNLAQRYLSLCEIHVIGHEGFTLQVQGKNNQGELDSETNRHIEKELRAWGEAGICDAGGRHSLVGLCKMGVRSAARDGEMLWRLHDVQTSADNPWGFVVESLDATRLDHLLNEDLKNGNRIRLGVELSPSGRPVAYYLKTGEQLGQFSAASRRDSHERVLAEDIIHWFEPERPEQLRAAPWMTSGLLTLHQIDATQEAAIIACRAGASKMGFFQNTDGASADPHVLADEKDENGDLISEFDPGHMTALPKGWEFSGFDPRYPHEAYGEFMKVFYRELAVGWGVSYHALTGDLTDVNFSSIRSGTLEEREFWKVRQRSFSSQVLQRVYKRWLSAALMNGRFFKQRGRTNEARFLEVYGVHRWQGRRWPWVDPEKDINTVIKAINARLTSPQRAASELGVDVEEVLEEIAQYNQMLADKELSNTPVVPDGKTGPQSNKESDNANVKSVA